MWAFIARLVRGMQNQPWWWFGCTLWPTPAQRKWRGLVLRIADVLRTVILRFDARSWWAVIAQEPGD